MKSVGLYFTVAALALGALCARAADDRIFDHSVFDAATRDQYTQDVLAAAELKLDDVVDAKVITTVQRDEIRGWFQRMPFQRIVDVELGMGMPDLVGFCLEANPNQYLSVEACAGSVILMSSLAVNIKSRFIQYLAMQKETRADGSVGYHGHEFSVGPGFGVRKIFLAGLDGPDRQTYGISALLSAEWVYWFSKYFGLSLQFDTGVTYSPAYEGRGPLTLFGHTIFFAGLSIGFTF